MPVELVQPPALLISFLAEDLYPAWPRGIWMRPHSQGPARVERVALTPEGWFLAPFHFPSTRPTSFFPYSIYPHYLNLAGLI